jgi:ribose transport system substrate-binding protein
MAGLPSDLAVAEGVKQAAKALGWQVRNIDGFKQTDPSTLISTLDTALVAKPTAVISLASLPESVWKSELPKYQAAGVILLPMYAGPLGALSSTLPANLGSPDDVQAMGEAVGRWVALQAGNQAKKVLVWNLPVFPIIESIIDGFRSAVSKYCQNCQLQEVDGTIAEVTSGNATQPIISALQRGTYDFFFSPQGAFTSTLASGLKTAGVNGVTITSVTCGQNNEADVLAGTEAVCVGYPFTISGYMAVDTILRDLQHMPIPPGDGGLPRPLLLTKGNADAWQAGATIDNPKDYAQQFAKLWHLS